MNPAKLRSWSMCAVVAGLLALTGCGDGDGDSNKGNAEPKHQLSLTVHRGESRQGEQLGAAKLTCEPTGGDHANAKQACGDLASVNGDFTKLARAELACILIYQPVTAVVTGNWGSAPVTFEKTYGNSCELGASTGAVFKFPVKD